jgi:isopenicillin N synthase-like dioxygenase
MMMTQAACRAASAEEVPILDLSVLAQPGGIAALAAQLRQACVTTGFFYVKNHGIPEELVQRTFETTKRYFDLPEERRLAHRMDERFRRGFMPQGINQHPGYAPDLKESYEIGLDLPLTDPDVMAGLPLHGPNRWPADFPELKEVVEVYFAAAQALGMRLLRPIAASVGMPEDFFYPYTTKPMVQMRLFHYPPQPPVSESQFGVAPHTDYGLVTLLLQDPIGGLELRKRDGEWIAAPYVPGTLVVNIGDLFQRWTNDIYISNFHRVVNRTGRERFSIPLFFNLDYRTVVECLPTCCSPQNPPRHAPTTCGDYLVSRFKTVQKLKVQAA